MTELGKLLIYFAITEESFKSLSNVIIKKLSLKKYIPDKYHDHLQKVISIIMFYNIWPLAKYLMWEMNEQALCMMVYKKVNLFFS